MNLKGVEERYRGLM